VVKEALKEVYIAMKVEEKDREGGKGNQ